MKQKNRIKLQLIKNGLYDSYRNKFCQKQIRFITTKIMKIMEIKVSDSKMFDVEKCLVNNDSKIFETAFSKLSKEIRASKLSCVDFNSLGKFLFLIFQTAVFYSNKRKNIPNIFLTNNFVDLNIKKKILFNDFCQSLKSTTPDHNKYIIQILKAIK